MGLLELLGWAVALVISLLVGAGFVMVSPPHDNYTAARRCFWCAAIILWGFAVAWGVREDYAFWIRATVSGLLSAVAAIGLMMMLRVVYKREHPDKPAVAAAAPSSRSNFSTTIYQVYIGDQSQGTDVTGKVIVKLNNPIILLMRIDNIGDRASIVQNVRLIADLDGQEITARRDAIIAPMAFTKDIVIHPDSDLRFKQEQAIEPSQSATAAAYFVFVDEKRGFLKNPSVTLRLEFKDIYNNTYKIPVDKPMSKGKAVEIFPGIKYGRDN